MDALLLDRCICTGYCRLSEEVAGVFTELTPQIWVLEPDQLQPGCLPARQRVYTIEAILLGGSWQ